MCRVPFSEQVVAYQSHTSRSKLYTAHIQPLIMEKMCRAPFLDQYVKVTLVIHMPL